MGLEITLLGDLSVHGVGADPTRRHSVGSSQARVALALLTLERGQGVTRDALADAMWPDRLPSSWASVLRTVVSRVRAFLLQVLGDDEELLVARGGTYLLRLPDDTRVDVEVAAAQIASARRALDHHDLAHARRLAVDATDRLRAPLLPDRDGDWVTAQRAHLTELLVVGLEVTSQSASALGDGADALTAAMEAVGRAPLRESAHRCLMAAHAAAGNRAEALRAYQRLRRMLAEELGVDPDAETEAAYLGLLGPPRSLPLAARDDERRQRLTADAPAPLVGRDVELKAASEAWVRALGRPLQIVLVTGEAGIGKTRFANEFAQHVTAQSGQVLFGRCDPEAITPYQPFVELLDALVAVTPDDEMPELSPAARGELAAVLPSFAGSGDPNGTATRRTVLFDAVIKLIDSAARAHPLLIVLDDLHWIDRDSSSLLRYLLRTANDTRLLVLACARGDPRSGHALGETLQAMERDGCLHHIRLGGLDKAACTTLARHVLPETGELQAMATRLVADTSGNPFMLMELLRAYADGAPPPWPMSGTTSAGLRDLVATRLTGLEPATQTLLVAAAVSGSRFELDVAASAAGLDEPAAVEALDGALTAGLVVEVGTNVTSTSYRFAHDIVRRTLYRELSRAKRRHLHERVADAIEDGRQERLPRYVPALAHHRCASAEEDGDVRAVHWALAAARLAQSVGAPTEAVRWCRQALDHVAPGDAALEAEVLTELGLAQTLSGETDGDVTLFESAIRARRSGRLDLVARAALGVADLARERPQFRQDAEVLVRDVLNHDRNVADEGPRPSRELWARLVARLVELGHASTGVTTTQMATAAAILRRQLDGLDAPDHHHDRRCVADDLHTLGLTMSDVGLQLVAHHHRAMAAAVVGDVPASDDALAAMARAVEECGDPMGDRLLDEHRLAVAVTKGRFSDVGRPDTNVRIAAAIARSQLGTMAPADMAAHQRLMVRWLRGRLGNDANGEHSEHHELAELLPGEATLMALGRGERGRARVAARELANGSEPLPVGDSRLHTLGVLSLAAVDLDDAATAGDLIELLTPYATLTCGAGYRSFVGTASFHLGRLAAVLGEWADAERHLTAALGQLTPLRAKPWIALAQHALAQVVENRGRSSDRAWVTALRVEAQWLAGQLGLRLVGPKY
jgi:DNA-binding SARP family transcriptional activator